MNPNPHITTPKQAIIFSLVGIVGCTGLALISFWAWGFIFSLFILFFCLVALIVTVALPWAWLRLDTRNQSVRAHNGFVFLIALVIFSAIISQWGAEKAKIPLWAIIIPCVGAVLAYSVMVYHATMNFSRWINGEFRSPDSAALETASISFDSKAAIVGDESIKNLQSQLFSEFGEDNIKLTTKDDSRHSLCFKLKDIPATFSVITIDGSLPLNVYSIQIENHPPGEYIYTDDEISLDDFIGLIRRYTTNIDDWPLQDNRDLYGI